MPGKGGFPPGRPLGGWDMRIDLVCNDGSPLGVIPEDIYGRGLGGAELAMISLMETLAARGHEVKVFNDPRVEGQHNGVFFLSRKAYNNRSPRDALIIFRSPNTMVRYADVRQTRLIWWSTDQYTVGDFRHVADNVQFGVAISPFHADFLVKKYAIPKEKLGVIDLGVRLQDYQQEVPKVRNRLIFTSVPDRGLQVLHACWPLLQREVPDASLVITSDYRLWGLTTPNNHYHRLAWAGAPNVQFMGRIPRAALCREQLKAEILAYPCTYDELFCIAVAEASVAGALPLTSAYGALPTTNDNGILIPGTPTDPTFVKAFVSRLAALLTDERNYLEAKIPRMMTIAQERFNWTNIAEKWEYVLEHAKLPEAA